MSAYFQRLIQQSELQIQPAPVAASPAPMPPLASPRRESARPESADLVEIHEEHVADAPPATLSRADDVARPPLPPPTRESRMPTERVTTPESREVSPTPLVIHETETAIVAERIEIPSLEEPSTANPSETLTPTAPERTTISDAPSPKTETARNREMPSDIMQAVMKWIAAGSQPNQDAAPASNAPSTPANASSTPTMARDPSSRPKSEEKPREKIPERVIKLVEATAPPFPQEQPIVPARPLAPAAERSVRVAPENPVRVSIGSIQVRVDAPAPAAPKAMPRAGRAGEPARATPQPTTRASGFSKLRRHYIIPH